MEYIIIDGGSTGGILDILRRYERLIDYWESEQDKGVYDTFNKTCRLITGEWMIFLGARDVLNVTEVLELISDRITRAAVEIEIAHAKVCVANGKICRARH